MRTAPEDDDLSPMIGAQQLAAAALPTQRLTDLVGQFPSLLPAASAIPRPFRTNGARKARR